MYQEQLQLLIITSPKLWLKPLFFRQLCQIFGLLIPILYEDALNHIKTEVQEKKRTAYSYVQASYAQRLVELGAYHFPTGRTRKGRGSKLRVASPWRSLL